MSMEPAEVQARLEHILPRVQKPGRYTGGELNQIVKEWDATSTRVALAFPDIYDLGMSNLGLAILYDALNLWRPSTRLRPSTFSASPSPTRRFTPTH